MSLSSLPLSLALRTLSRSTPAMLSFRIFNIQVHVQPWFWLTLGVLGGGLSANSERMIFVLMFVVAGFISILAHELGHALTIRKFGLPTEIHLIAFGGYATFPAGILSRKESFLVTAAGPAIQLMLGVVAYGFLYFASGSTNPLLIGFLFYLMWVSIAWALLNCLPVFPMDGGQMLSSILGPNRRHITFLVGMITAIACGVIAYLLLNQLFLALFMGYFAYQNWQNYQSARARGIY